MEQYAMIYFDSAGSFPLLDESRSALVKALDHHHANPSASHSLGCEATNSIEQVREQIADAIGAMPSEIVFTSGATESNNLALKGLFLNYKTVQNSHIITSRIEHKCILSICNYLESCGHEITYLKPNDKGLIDAASVENALQPNTALVSVMHVNNELGTINPIEQIGSLCLDNNVLFHTDAAQSFGKVTIDVEDMNIDMMSLSAHKIGGPKGIGAIYIRDARDIDITPVIQGAGQEIGLRGGTVATPLILGFGAALKFFPKRFKEFKFIELRKYLITRLEQEEVAFSINGVEGVPHIISLTLPDLDVLTFVTAYYDKFALAQGSACSSKEIKPSHVLSNMDLSTKRAERTLRLSFDFNTSVKAIDLFVDSLLTF